MLELQRAGPFLSGYVIHMLVTKNSVTLLLKFLKPIYFPFRVILLGVLLSAHPEEAIYKCIAPLHFITIYKYIYTYIHTYTQFLQLCIHYIRIHVLHIMVMLFSALLVIKNSG